MLVDIINLTLSEMEKFKFSNLAVASIDFNRGELETFQIENGLIIPSSTPIFFDLASLTKPLTLGVARIMYKNLFSKHEELLLNHCGGLPAWGRLSSKSWKELILSYEIKESPTLYSDFSALRLMLELEKKSGKMLYDLVGDTWDSEIAHWKELPDNFMSVVTGFRGGKEIYGQVHDDNAFIIGTKCSHAGLFGTVTGLSKTLLNLERRFSFVKNVESQLDKVGNKGYVMGWDRATDLSKTLAGKNATLSSFGHTGFTGCSIWIDPTRMKGTVILSNFCSQSWYDRVAFNDLRKQIGIIY